MQFYTQISTEISGQHSWGQHAQSNITDGQCFSYVASILIYILVM